MKLVEIKDVRIGQVWKEDDNDIFIITGFSEYEPEMIHCISYIPEDKPITLKNGKKITGLVYSSTSKNLLEKSTLIGKLGITHRIEDGKLVEITREYFQVDDVVTLADGSKWVLLHKQKFRKRCFDSICLEEVQCAGIFIDKSTKIGTIGITHEIVNDCEGEQ